MINLKEIYPQQNHRQTPETSLTYAKHSPFFAIKVFIFFIYLFIFTTIIFFVNIYLYRTYI